MKKLLKTEALPMQVLILGLAAALLRTLLYLTATDDKGLILRGHLLGWLLWLTCGVAALLVILSVRKLKGSNRYRDIFDPGIPGAAGSWVMALGLVLTLMAGNTLPRTGLVLMWKLSGGLAAAGLVWAGLDRLKGKRPFVAVYAALCLFLALQLVSRYQPWSGDPQSINWVFSMLAAAGMALTAYHHSGFCAGVGHRRLLLGSSLITVFLCLAALAHTEYLALYLCGGIWAFASMGRVMPVVRRKAAPSADSAAETE